MPNENEYIAEVSDGDKILLLIACKYITSNNGLQTIIHGIPNTGSIGFEVILAVVPNKYIVTLNELKTDDEKENI